MPLETATYLDGLVATNPAHTDGLSQADAHLRLLKSALKATFPNINGAITASDEQINAVAANGQVSMADGNIGTPSLAFSSDGTNGFYKASTGHVGVSKRIVGNGTNYVGEKAEFVIDPGTSVLARGGSATGVEPYLELDGSTYLIAQFPELAALLGTTYGGNGTTTFGVPNLWSGARYCRSRNSINAVGTTQTSSVISHSHTYSQNTDFAGSHNHGGGTGPNNVDHTHSDNIAATRNVYVPSGYGTDPRGSIWADSPTAASTTGGQSQPHSHTISSDGSHFHSFSGTTAASGVSETRPETFVTIMAVKT